MIAVRAQACPPKKSRIMIVYGLGCNRYTCGVRARHLHLNKIRNPDTVESVEVMCNTTDSKSMTYDIWRRLKNEDLGCTPFVEHVMTEVENKLSRDEPVILLGHSYGGSVVSRVGLLLKDTSKDLRIGTFGSIFVPPEDATGTLDIRHYMYRNDIAALCHKRSKSYKNLIFIDTPYKRNPIYSHMDYDRLIARVAETGTLRSLDSLHERLK